VPREQPQAGVTAQLPIEVCLTVARRRAKRMAEVISVLGGDDAVFYVPPGIAPPSPHSEELIDRAKLWVMAGDRHTAADIAAAFFGERYSVYDKLAAMVQSGVLTIDRRTRERTNSAVELAAGARGRLRSGDRAGAFAMAAQALVQDPNDPEVRKTFAQIERARVAEVAKQLLSRHRVPRRVKEPSVELGLSEAEVELAYRIDGRWDLLSLIRAANIREAEALLAFAHLAELGVVELG
jgi:DNA-binding Lrp family transcriptional regulator